MSTPNQDASSDGTFRSSITNPPTRRVETTRGQEGNDSHWQDLHRSVSDAYHPPSDLASASPISTQRTDSSEPAAAAYSHRQHSKHGNEGLNMRPPVLPPSKVPKASQNPSRGESSRSPAPPPLPQLPGLGKFSRLAPANTHSNDRPSASSDFPMDSAWRTSSPHSQRPLRSSAHPYDGPSASAADARHSGAMRVAHPAATVDNEAARLHELLTSPLAPPPMLSGLPHHSREQRKYKLIIRQQPQQGRLCGLGSKDKRPLDPLPILQLRIVKPDGTEDEDAENSSNLVLQVSLCKEDPASGTFTDAVLVETNDPSYPWTRMLEGRLVASANVARDLDGSRACFFVFTDLSIRQEGQFRLAFKLLAIGPPSFAPTSTGGHVLAEALTEPFTIYSPRRFPGMTESTELAKCLARQGIQVPVRNDIRRKQEQPDSMTASTDDMNNPE